MIEPTEVVKAIPLTAWEQAVIVILFGLFVIALLFLVLKIVTAVKPIVSETNNSFQAFILARDVQWQNYLRDLRESDNERDEAQNRSFAERNEQVVKALNALAGQIGAMQAFNLEHHQAMTAAVAEMHSVVEQRTRPRPRTQE
jgi:predicted PurR-regulated permease PerM